MRERTANDLQGHSLDAGEAGSILSSREDQLGSRACQIYGDGNVDWRPVNTHSVEL